MYLDIWANTCGCNENQFLGGDLNCRQCSPNCLTCQDGIGYCNTCAKGFFLNVTDGTCGCNKATQYLINGKCAPIANCPAGQFNPGNNICQPCADSNATTCAINTGKTTSCQKTFTLNSNGVCVCGDGSFLNSTTNTCQLCSKNSATCQDFTGKSITCLSAFTL